jgi:uncharacterized SAM-binding protein YcdF (DUF218 family)
MKKIKRILKFYLIVVGVLAHLGLIWMGLKLPFVFDRWLHVSHRPEEAEAIVCLAGGLAGDNLPTQRGLQRIYTAVQLYADGWASHVIFTGGGPGTLSEGEVYAEIAGWLGLPAEAAVVDPLSGSTAEHPKNILKLKEMGIGRDSPILVVTSPVHSRRAWLCFRKAGFSHIRMVTGYRARVKDAGVDRSLKESRFEDYTPSGKTYDDFLFRLRRRSNDFWEAVREYSAIGWYWVKGEV